jgi:hypothetical protein
VKATFAFGLGVSEEGVKRGTRSLRRVPLGQSRIYLRQVALDERVKLGIREFCEWASFGGNATI